MSVKSNPKGWIWVEKYRPQTVDDIILPSKYKNFFSNVIENGTMPNILLSSSNPGSGKTTLAKALARDLGIKPLYLNISSEGGIDTLRSVIKRHASTAGIKGKHKIVIMDEADGATPQLQAGLRAFIEEFHNTCRFILTCNYVSKIIQPLREGRIMEFDFNMTDKKMIVEMKPKMVKRLVGILKHEKVEYDINTVQKIVDTYFPNVRRMLSMMQKYSQMNGIIDDNIFNSEGIDSEFYEFILDKDFTNARQFVLDRAYNYEELFTKLYKEFVPKLDRASQAQAIITINEHQYQHSFVPDPEINFAACMLELMSLV
tara:strand:- start:384 stop:1328 length:945 start_codon:yes stop_codon:yes gene_type:complete